MKLTSEKARNILEDARKHTEEDKWINHCICVGNTAGRIAKALSENGINIDIDKTIALGYIHDIGKKYNEHGGVFPHAINGYNYIKELGYEEDFPIVSLKISFTGGKFASPVSHRDVLGAIIGLGIERQKIGDIFLQEGCAYVFVCDTVSKLILSALGDVGRNKVSVEEISSIPCDLEPKTERVRFSVASNRADSIVCKVFNLSREDGKGLFQRELVLVNGKSVSNPSRPLKENDSVAVRGFGKFTFVKEDGVSKKNKPYVEIELFV